MGSLITFYNFLDLTSVGKGTTLVSQARASNVIVIMGFGMEWVFSGDRLPHAVLCL